MKNKFLTFILAFLFLFFIASCDKKNNTNENQNNKPKEEEPLDEELKADYSLEPYVLTNKKETYALSFDYKTSFFNASAEVFNKDLAILSYGNSLASAKENDITIFYQALKFDNLNSKYKAPTKDTISYMFAHKKINDSNLVAVTVRGFNYDKEWANNFKLGTSGNHKGFDDSANTIYTDLKAYIAQYDNLKLWITGYSRAGAVSNLLSHLIISKKEINVIQPNMYVYTFEAPKAIAKENKQEYKNVFNVVNSHDIIPYFAPEAEYGLARCGIDIDIYSDSISDLILEFDKDIVISKFKEDAEYKNGVEFSNYMIKILTQNSDNKDYVYIPTREAFSNNMERPLARIFDIFYTLTSAQKKKIVEDVQKKIKESPLQFAMGLLMTENGVYNFIKPYLDEAGYNYEEEALKLETETIRKFIYPKIAIVLGFVASETALGNNMKRMLLMHYPEITYVLLMNYNAAK